MVAFRPDVGIAIGVLMVLCGCTPNDEQETDPAVSAPLPPATPAPAAPAPTTAHRLVANDSPPPGADREFRTDFSRSLIDFSEVISGGPPRDGIPAITNPQFTSMTNADQWIGEHETVFIINGRRYGNESVHIYPVQILIYHEIVNDRFNEHPITVTYCPLCNSAVAFNATVDGNALLFGVSGRLRFSNMIMYDDQTESWWQQATGMAIVGQLVGTQLEIAPLLTVSWAEAKEQYTDAVVLSRDTGYHRPYGQNPYVGYDTLDHPFLFRGRQINTQEEPFARVVVGRVNGAEKPFLYSTLEQNIVTHDNIGGSNVVLLWASASASPLDRDAVATGRRVGSANIFSTQVDGRSLTFTVRNHTIIDRQTGSSWSPLGVATAGALAGEQLTPLPSIQHFWFSYNAFAAER